MLGRARRRRRGRAPRPRRRGRAGTRRVWSMAAARGRTTSSAKLADRGLEQLLLLGEVQVHGRRSISGPPPLGVDQTLPDDADRSRAARRRSSARTRARRRARDPARRTSIAAREDGLRPRAARPAASPGAKSSPVTPGTTAALQSADRGGGHRPARGEGARRDAAARDRAVREHDGVAGGEPQRPSPPRGRTRPSRGSARAPGSQPPAARGRARPERLRRRSAIEAPRLPRRSRGAASRSRSTPL